MDQLKSVYCHYDMVCDRPKGGGVEIMEMPSFFHDGTDVETSYAHVHNFYEIVWYREGEGSHFVDFCEYRITPDSVFFIAPGQIHSFDRRHDQRGYVIKICSDMLNDTLGDATYLKYDLFNADSSPLHTIDDNQVARLERLLADIRNENSQHEMFGHKDYVRSLLRMLIILIERGRRTQEQEVLNHSKISHRTFLAFRQLVERNFRTKHTVKEYASMLNVTTKTLTNYTSECSPMTPLEIINERIALEAKRELRFSNRMIKEIGYGLGFEDPSYFVKFFKRQTKMLPAEFREESIKNKNITPKYRPMKIAIPTRDGIVDSHFGHCDHYTIIETNEQNEICATSTLASPEGCGCKSNIAHEMQEMGITLMLAGNMGQGAVNKLSSCGIQVIKGCSGDVMQLVNDYLNGKVEDNPQVCDHHECGHHSEIPVFKINI